MSLVLSFTRKILNYLREQDFPLAEGNLHLHRDLTHIFDIGSNAMFHPIHAVLANHRFVQQPAGRLDGPQKSAWSGEKPFYVRCGPGCYRSTCQAWSQTSCRLHWAFAVLHFHSAALQSMNLSLGAQTLETVAKMKWHSPNIYRSHKRGPSCLNYWGEREG